jgi:hypothetical protein
LVASEGQFWAVLGQLPEQEAGGAESEAHVRLLCERDRRPVRNMRAEKAETELKELEAAAHTAHGLMNDPSSDDELIVTGVSLILPHGPSVTVRPSVAIRPSANNVPHWRMPMPSQLRYFWHSY